MARVRENQFYGAVANSLNKSDKIVKKYMETFIEQLFKEMNRGNEVTINGFATFTPKLVGGEEMNVCGVKKYVEPRVTIDMKLTPMGLQVMNNAILDSDSKKRLKSGNLLPYEKEILGIPMSNRKNLEEVFYEVLDGKEEE